MSASDPKGKCRAFVEGNPGKCTKPTHWHRNLNDQSRSKPCAYHPCSLQCSAAPEHVDFGICGTPCHPYSTQRSGRWAASGPSAVTAHQEYSVAMADFFEWFTAFTPKVTVFEQVMGFAKPIHAGASMSPYDLLFGSRKTFPVTENGGTRYISSRTNKLGTRKGL